MAEIEDKNKRLREIAFMQSHLFRAPLARLKGLVNLFDQAESESSKNELIDHIKFSVEEMDQVVRDIVSNTAERSL